MEQTQTPTPAVIGDAKIEMVVTSASGHEHAGVQYARDQSFFVEDAATARWLESRDIAKPASAVSSTTSKGTTDVHSSTGVPAKQSR